MAQGTQKMTFAHTRNRLHHWISALCSLLEAMILSTTTAEIEGLGASYAPVVEKS